ncbi:NADH-quinone oxidoreductase subunit L [Halarchaeum rubridurum]|uniref:NADH-quinone oxidoreductase subunit L n=1 Tax=Halarchaeum rubridurum TaxID=489911 RepID=A0A830G2R5_9EURY|nr:NADH-quinone oxidoreductase subunit L [Halarchaeum rubridurum]MBP1955513.1 NADH-quinone oxidoreductase subunit L [Halarchaeum rubridurum]GGM72918.1 NADH-quinone oxidoreductase subunit L [Halarchaeum rubridurum]
MADVTTAVTAIPLVPFAAFLVALLVGHYKPAALPKGGALAGIAATAVSLALSVWAFLTVGAGGATLSRVWTWVPAANDSFALTFGVLVDPLSALMVVIVSGVSLLVHVFSLGYMNDEGEGGLPRYYAGLGLFTASMLAFALASNLLQAFVFFELVGFCSWWLIGHWFREPGPASAAKKAFLVTRFGDYFLLVGLVGVLGTFGTAAFAGDASFPALAHAALEGEASVNTFGVDPATWFTTLGLLILGGVIGKSAQFPLQTWLPDAMEGPTPVSALIHAATMVAAGVYLVARLYGFYALTPTVLTVIALVGGFTALFAATMALVKREIKQVLAYSTISQYGYIMLGLGSGGYVAGVFHLLTHATFKALLFLGAGAVIIAMHHDEDMWKMGGLKERMPTVYWAFLSGSLALAGIVPFAGFWSKDAVLHHALTVGLGGQPLVLLAYLMGLVAVAFTGFYTFRMVFLTFHGEPRSETARDAGPASANMRVPVAILGVLAAVVGLVNVDPLKGVVGEHLLFLERWLNGPLPGLAGPTAEHYHELVVDVAGFHTVAVSPTVSAVVSLVVALAGVALAWTWYNVPEPSEKTDVLGPTKTLLYNNYYQDEFQTWLATGVVEPLADAVDVFDASVVDGVVNGVSSTSLVASDRLRRVQTGVVTTYTTQLVLGLVVLLLIVLLLGGWF